MRRLASNHADQSELEELGTKIGVRINYKVFVVMKYENAASRLASSLLASIGEFDKTGTITSRQLNKIQR